MSTDGPVRNVAWQSPDGSNTLIAYNDTDNAQRIRIRWGGQVFACELPARVSATYAWTADPS